jgi:SAM-dependent methyltransferase
MVGVQKIMKRDFTSFENHLDRLMGDIYPQPEDPGHTTQAKASIDWAYSIIETDSVLDVGCGQGFCCKFFDDLGIFWTGVTVGRDYDVCMERRLNVYPFDMSFLNWEDKSFQNVYARHTLEHSPFPILTLMEWKRVCSGCLVVIVPSPDYYGVGGKNHYSVFSKEEWWWTFTRAGWNPIHEKTISTGDHLFMDFYRPEITNEKKRAELQFPGHPKTVEYWYILEQAEERIE